MRGYVPVCSTLPHVRHVHERALIAYEKEIIFIKHVALGASLWWRSQLAYVGHCPRGTNLTHREMPLTVYVPESGCEVDAALIRPDEAKWLLLLAHKAGAGMRHPFMESLARELAACHVATLRYQSHVCSKAGRDRIHQPC